MFEFSVERSFSIWTICLPLSGTRLHFSVMSRRWVMDSGIEPGTRGSCVGIGPINNAHSWESFMAPLVETFVGGVTGLDRARHAYSMFNSRRSGAIAGHPLTLWMLVALIVMLWLIFWCLRISCDSHASGGGARVRCHDDASPAESSTRRRGRQQLLPTPPTDLALPARPSGQVTYKNTRASSCWAGKTFRQKGRFFIFIFIYFLATLN